jgi:phosphonate transport system ATP-binding protein
MNKAAGASIRLEKVSKRFTDGTVALSDLSLQVPAGTFCVLLGPSGSGKSTLLRCLNGLETPSQGSVYVDETLVNRNSIKQLRKKIGSIHQQFGLVQRDHVANNVLAGALSTLPTWQATLGYFPRALQARAAEMLEQVGLDPVHLHRRAGELSGGQQQRVGIARAFMLVPKLILADEPIASLDPKTSYDILALIREQAQNLGATVLCSLHQVDLARVFADRIIGLKAGTVVFDGAPSDLTADMVDALYGQDQVAVAPEYA